MIQKADKSTGPVPAAYRTRYSGFSLTEVLVAAGILTVGMMLVLTLFPLGIQLTAETVKQNMASVVASEAFAKVRLHIVNVESFIDANDDTEKTELFDNAAGGGVNIRDWDFYYPSTPLRAADASDQPESSRYFWSALIRPVNPQTGIFQVTVLVFYRQDMQSEFYTETGTDDELELIEVSVTDPGMVDIESWLEYGGDHWLITEDSPIIDSKTGRIYRVMEKRVENNDAVFRIDRGWVERYGDPDQSSTNSDLPADVWIVPPPVGASGTNCIGVFQRVMSVEN
ncbi:type IV pilus modification protein PilV [Limihaloglobus sulfuriphilus]|uniref:Type IV pilus modification protein PilV n=1 Tax=Limihaloglobus sulfuriphilus TaxID=1851148 RepID=A0A1Q2MCZ5_9BACT|nr:prepilin-type N-terminal cleavage/methylation domain-containing protein [Limihaloglobus sulfuriphilus]AQQ70122.1 type IV pilus modification protein PilV [Limihaloglobus sulfuriphilus]